MGGFAEHVPYLAVPAPFRLELCSIKAIESMDRWERPR